MNTTRKSIRETKAQNKARKTVKKPNNHGLAIELAITLMVVVFVLCALLTSLCMISRGSVNQYNERLCQKYNDQFENEEE